MGEQHAHNSADIRGALTITITLHNFESKTDLGLYLSTAVGGGVVVGPDAEAPREYYALDITNKNGVKLRVGIVSSDHGVRPSWASSADDNILAVGHDQSVTFIDVRDRRLASTSKLDGVFFEFTPQADRGCLIVLHELGVAKFDFSGKKLWSVLTPDIVESALMRNNKTLIVRHQGPGKEFAIDILTGHADPRNVSS